MRIKKEVHFFIFLLFILVLVPIILADPITSLRKEQGFDGFNITGTVYELSETVLNKGIYFDLNEGDAVRVSLKERSYTILFSKTINNKIELLFPLKRKTILGVNKTILADMDRDGKFDIEFKLVSLNKSAKIFIRRYEEKIMHTSGDYLELFDVTVKLAREKLASSKELEALITFENFGEGASKVNIVYSIIDKNSGKEVYHGIDTKVVQTEEQVVKDFNFLNLKPGKYILTTKIFYGKNQTGSSQQDFEIVEPNVYSLLSGPIIFIMVILALLGIIYLTKKSMDRD